MTKARTDQTDTSADLSEAARAVVRDAGDPRIDAHLRALGLAMDEADTPDRVAELVPVMAPEDPETVRLRSKVVELEAALATSGRNVRILAAALVAAVVAGVLLALLLVAR